ncbi:MAG: class I SAM-dependent methyltransferase family protein [Candidatus Nanohaloarchaea archaeon]
MEQQELEERVEEIFERQGFSVERDGNRILAEDDEDKLIAVFSSEEYSARDIAEEVEGDELVFVDEDLSELKDRLENQVSVIREEEEEKDHDLPSYEVIGDIAVINELGDRDREDVIEGIREYNPHVKTILLKKNGLGGEFRVGDYEKLYGDETETTHTEFGCRFRVDPTEVYYSERFSTERDRVVSQVEDGERVLVMFAGVGPFAVMAARNAGAEVMAIEKNPAAVEYMRENVELNSVADSVEVIEGDAADAVPDGKFDRVVMPLPESADEFLDAAFEHVSEGGVIHYYRFIEDENWQQAESEVEEAASAAGRGFEIKERVVCGERGPGVQRVCLDIEVR